MYRVFLLFLGVFTLFVYADKSSSFIILSHTNTKQVMLENKAKYDDVLKTDKTIDSLIKGSGARLEAKRVNQTYILKLGPFNRGEALALTYFKIKELFDYAFIIEDNVQEKVKEVIVPQEKVIVKEVIKEDIILWIALFISAIVGVAYIYISSTQMNRLKRRHEEIKEKHKRLEQKQHEVLSTMSENIHTIAKETMTHTSKMAENMSKSKKVHVEMAKVIQNENELVDVTEDLIRFLRLKSNKVEINNEIFNFNHVLNEVAGFLLNIYKEKDIELIFDIDQSVPRYMEADSLNLGQVLMNLLEYFVQYSKKKEIRLGVEKIRIKGGFALRFQIDTDVKIENKESLFDSYYDEASKRYVGLGLFVAKELTTLMNGEFILEDEKTEDNSLVFTIPMEEKGNEENRKYHLPDKKFVGKKVVIIDNSQASAEAIERLFLYFNARTKIILSENFKSHATHFELYDIVVILDRLLTTKIIKELKSMKRDHPIKIVTLENLFSSTKPVYNNIIDVSLKKPLTQEHVFDKLIELYHPKDKKVVEEEPKTEQELKDSNNKTEKKKEKKPKLLIHRGPFVETVNINLESFKDFAKTNLLVVEDNVVNQKVVKSILGKSEMNLSFSENGKEAIDFLEENKNKIDFVLMDINMPIMDGFTATKMIRKNSELDNIPVVSLTALASEHEIQKMFDSGMNGYLNKPVSIEKLYTAFSTFLNVQTRDASSLDEEFDINEESTELEGLDITKGIKHMRGNTIFYKEVLEEFIDAYSKSDTTFENLVKENRLEQIKLLCIDMKGITGTIEATELNKLIQDIHQALIYGQAEKLPKYVEPYKKTLKILNKSINSYLSK